MVTSALLARLRVPAILCTLLFGCVGCDQATKRAAEHWLRGSSGLSFWPGTLFEDTVRLVYTENPGAFLSLGATWPPQVRFAVLTLGAAVATLVLVGFLFVQGTRLGGEWQALGGSQPLAAPSVAQRERLLTLAGSLLFVSGSIGNLIDRVLRDGRVIDFMNVGFGSVRTGVFNVADVQIMLGAALIALGAFASRVEQQRESRPSG